MTSSTSNIEAVARDICSKQLSRPDCSNAKLAAEVDRYWHCVAAELEAGLINDAGERIPSAGPYEGVAAYRDWCLRHPDGKPTQ